MARKKKSDKKDPNALNVEREKDQSAEDALAQAVLRPSFQATVTLRDYSKSYGDLSLQGLIDGLHEQMDATRKGDLGRGEAMLTAQAHTLDAIFNNLARRAINAEYMSNLDTYLKLALRAQSQCHATWEAISAIKNPPVMGYVRQANITNGPQQVNNGAEPPRARENQELQNELLEHNNGERLDTGATGATGTIDPAMAPVGELNRTEDG